jgi:citrate lyase subunit beta/citryl-CoA lyase
LLTARKFKRLKPPDIQDKAGLEAYVSRARRDGFSAMMAIHPIQVATINSAFTPTTEDRYRCDR